jgi:hypothetical protein
MSRSMLGFLQHILNETQYLMDRAKGVTISTPSIVDGGVRPRLLLRKPTVFCMCPYSGT